MALATDSIMGSLPLAEPGVWSPMNDPPGRRCCSAWPYRAVSRLQLLMDLGAHRRRRLTQPAEAAAAPSDSIGGALAGAPQVGAKAAPLVAAPNSVCISGMQVAVWGAGGMIIAGAVVTWIFLPARPCDEQTALVGELEGAPVPPDLV